MLHISFHASIDYMSAQFVERLLAAEMASDDPSALIYLCSGGGDGTAGVGLYHFIKALPYPVHVHATGMCASGAVSLLLAGNKRTCSPTTFFMLHGSKAPDGSLSPQTPLTSIIFEKEIGWDQNLQDHFFSNVDEKWFGADEGKEKGIIQNVETIEFPAGAIIHVVPAT